MILNSVWRLWNDKPFTQLSGPPGEQQLRHRVEETSASEVDPSLFQSTGMFLYKEAEVNNTIHMLRRPWEDCSKMLLKLFKMYELWSKGTSEQTQPSYSSNKKKNKTKSRTHSSLLHKEVSCVSIHSSGYSAFQVNKVSIDWAGLNDEEEFLQFLLVLNQHLGLAAGVKLSQIQ